MALARDPETGEYLYWTGSDWVPAKLAEDPATKERLAWDGSAWKSLGKTPSGFGAALSSGVDTLQQALYSAGEGGAKTLGLEGLAKFAGEGAARNKAEAEAALPNQASFSEAKGLGDFWQAAKEGLGTSLPQMAPAVVAGALSGGALGSLGGPLGTGAGAIIGGAAAGIPQFYGYFRERQKEESGAVQSEGAALLAAVPAAAMDALLGKIFPGAGKAVTGNILTRVVKKGATGAAIEVPTEVGQQVLERLQAGLPIADEKALAEYKEAAIAAGVLGGGLGGAGGAYQKRAMSSDELARLAGRTEDDQLAQNIEEARAGVTPTPPPAAAAPTSAGTAAAPTVTAPPGTPPGTPPATAPATAPDATGASAAPAAEPDPSATAPEDVLNQQAAEAAAAANVSQEAPLTSLTPNATILTYTPEQLEAYVEALPSNAPIDVRELAQKMGADPNAIRDMLEDHPRMTRQKKRGIYVKDMELPPAPDLPPLDATAAPEVAPAPAVEPAATDDFNELPPPPTPEEIRARYGEIGNEEPTAPSPAAEQEAAPEAAEPQPAAEPAPALRKGTSEEIRQKIAAMPLGAPLKPNIIAEQLRAEGIWVPPQLVAAAGYTMAKQGFLGRPNARVKFSRTAMPYVSPAEAQTAKAARAAEKKAARAAQPATPAATEPSSEEVVDPADFAPAQPEPVANPLPAQRRAAAQAKSSPPVAQNQIADVVNQYIDSMAPGDRVKADDLARELNANAMSFLDAFEANPNVIKGDMFYFTKVGEQAAPAAEVVPQEVQSEPVAATANPLPAQRRAAAAAKTTAQKAAKTPAQKRAAAAAPVVTPAPAAETVAKPAAAPKPKATAKPAAPVVEENLPDEEIDFDEHPMMKEHESKTEDAVSEIEDTENTTDVRKLAKKFLREGIIDEDGMSNMDEAIREADKEDKFDTAKSSLEEAINENADNAREDVEERIREYEQDKREAVEKVTAKPAPKPSKATAPETKAEPEAEAAPVDRVAEIKKAAEAVKAKKAAAKATPEATPEAAAEQAAPEETAPKVPLTEQESQVLAAINRAPLGTNKRISLPLVQKALQENTDQSEAANAVRKMKLSEIKAMLPALLEKGAIQTDPEDANFFQRKQKTRVKAEATAKVPKTREKRREATARRQATENLDQPKTVNATVEKKPAKKTKAVSFAEALSKEKNPDNRLIQLLELGPVEEDMSFEDFAKEIQRVIRDKLASTPEGEPLFDATSLVNARDEIEALDTQDGDTIEQAQKLLADAIENTKDLLEPPIRADIKQAWAAEEDTGPEIKGEMTDAEKLKKRFNDLHGSRSLTFGDVNKLVTELMNEKRFDPRSEYWVTVQPEIQGSTNPREYLEKFEKRFYGDKSAAPKKAATEGKTKKQIANDKIEALYDENGKVSGPAVEKLTDEFVRDGLLTPTLAAGIKGYLKTSAVQAAAKLNGAVNTGELSTRSATAPETAAAPEAAAEAKEKTKKKRTKRRKSKGKKKSAAAPKTEDTVEPPTPKTPEELAAIEERRVAAQRFLDERLAQMEASGPFGQKAATAVREVLANGDISHTQAHHAFMMAEIASKLLKGTGANPDIKFLNNVDYNGRRLRKGHPDALAGLIEFSLNDNPQQNILGYSKETAAHEPFHVLQDLMEEYDPATSKILFGTRTGIDPETGHGIYKGGAFRDGMTPKDIPSSIRRTLEALSPDASGESYWSKFTQDYNNAPETPALDADGNPIPNLRTEFGKQREAMAYVFGMLADAKSRGFNTNAMDAPFKRFLYFLTKFREKMGNFLRGRGYESTDQVLEDYISGERQQGYGGEVDRTGKSEYSYVGKGAKNWSRETQARAEALEEQGETPDMIYFETGLHRGLRDGEWRAEVFDTDASLERGGLELMAKGRKVGLQDVFDHPDLYDNYPGLVRDQIMARDIQSGKAFVTPVRGAEFRYNVIEVSKTDVRAALNGDPDTLLDAVVHEVQHIIQEREGFSPGAESTKSLKAKVGQQIRDAVGNLTDDVVYSVKPSVAATPEVAAVMQQFKKDVASRVAKWEVAFKKDTTDPKTMYLGEPGEREGRSTEARRKMSAGELRATLPDAISGNYPYAAEGSLSSVLSDPAYRNRWKKLLREAAAKATPARTEGEFSVRGRQPTFIRSYKEVRQEANSRADWRDWYDRYEDLLQEMFGTETKLFKNLLSATSQMSPVSGNVTLALKAYEQLKSGKPFTGYLRAVEMNLERIRQEEAVRGQKISEYDKANTGDAEGIAVDRHVAMIMFGHKTPNAAEVAVAKEWIRDIAKEFGWTPREVQASLWAANQVIQGKDPADVRSYDYYLKQKAAEIAALRSAFNDVGGTTESVRDGSENIQQGEGSGRGLGEFSVRGGRLSRDAELAIRSAQAQSTGRNLTTSNRIMNTLKKAFDPLALIQDRKRYMIMRYLAMGNDTALQEEAKGFYDKISALPKAQQDTIYKYLTTRGAIAPNLPPQIKKLAIDVKTRINSIGDRMVQRGMISKESLAEYKDQYLPRIYMKYLMEGKPMAGIGLRAGPQGQLRQRKDFSEQDRVAMGEVTNPGFLSYMALYRPERDMAMLDFLSNIANASDVDWVWPESLINYKGMKVTSFWLVDEATAIRQRMKSEPDDKKRAQMKKIAKEMQDLADPHIGGLVPENYKQLPKSARYGALKGMVVRQEIYDDIVGAAEINPDANFIDRTFGDKNSTLAKGTAFWKMTKTILNPPTQVRNFISNAVMLSLSGVSPFQVGPRILQAMKAMRNNEKAWQIAKQYGVKGAGFSDNELTIAQDIMEEYLANNKSGIMNPAVIGRVFATIATKAGNAYQWSEHVFKTAKIIDELEKNKVSSIRDKAARERAEGEAALEGHKWFFDYSLVPPSIKSLRTMPFGAPFITYYYKALPRMIEVLSNPRTAMRFAPYIAFQMAMPAMVASMYDADDEDVDKIKMALSEHLRENGSINIFPLKDQNGNWQFLDWGYFFPWQMFVKTGQALATGDVAGALGSVGALSSPALSAITAIKTNIDPFSGREIINKADPPNEQMNSFLKYIAQLALPPFVTSTGAVGKAYEAMTNTGLNKYGEPNQDAIQIGARLFGFNFYPVVPDMQRARNIGVMQRDLNDVIGRMNMVASDQSIPEDEREPKLETYREEIQERADKLRQYAEDSDVPGFLLKRED